jgi:PAS domain S-box-containing protein/putative nucleotidyltransferase with HDIG domain
VARTLIASVKRREKALPENGELFRSIISDLPISVLIVGDGKAIYVNRAFQDLIGISEDKIGGHSILDFLTDESKSVASKNIARRLAGEKVSDYQVEIETAHEGRRTVIVRGIPIPFEGSQAILVALLDITCRKRAEEALRASEERWKMLFDFAPDAYYLSDLKGNFIDGNLAAERLLGYNKNELIGQSFLELKILPPSFLAKAAALLAENALGSPTGPDEFVLERKDGKLSTVEIRTHPVKIEGRTLILGIARDITERKDAEETLRESEAFLSNIVENIPDMIFVKDAKDLRFIRFNKAGEELLGYTRQELIGKNDCDFFPQKEAAFFTGKDREVLAKKQVFDISEEEIQTRHHGLRILHTKKVPILDSNGNPAYLLGISEDITERKRAEEALRERDQQFRSITATAPDALLVTRASDGLILYANEQAGRLVAIPASDLIYQRAPDFLAHPENRQTFRTMLMRGPVKDWGVLLKRADGSPFWALVTGQLGTFEGEAAIYVGLRDITDRKRAEEAIRTSEAQLSNALRIAHAGHWEYDVDSDTFTFNDNFYRIFRTTAEEVGGYQMSSAEYARRFCHPDDMHLVRQETDAAIKTDDPYYGRELEHRILYSNGEVGYIAVRFFIVKDSEGRTVKTYGVNQEITERKRAEETLRQNEARLRQSMREAINSLSSAIEMRDPYTAGHQAQVTKLAVAIGQEIGLAEESIEALQISGMVHDIGKLGIPAEILSKPTKLTQIESDMIKTHAEIGFEILDKIEFPWPIAKIVHQHHERIDGSGYPMGVIDGEILLEARIIAVADVVEAMMSHRPYRPALGLEKALEEISRNKGTLYDPRVVDACLKLFSKNKTVLGERIMKNNKVLVADDEIVSLSMLRSALTKAGYRVIAASSGTEAVELAQKHLPFVAILDINMPEMEGSDVAAAFKKNQETKDIPVIFLSGLISPDEEKFTAGDGSISLMAKPFTLDKLLNEVRKHYSKDIQK